ncbi:MAG: hypothetical protein ACYTG7_11470 [Planctomycetota bacterium]
MMRKTTFLETAVSLLLLGLISGVFLSPAAIGQTQIQGEKLDPADYGKGFIESMEKAIERDKNLKGSTRPSLKDRGDRQGVWQVPNRRATYHPHSGEHYVTNKWGDTRMSIGFPGLVNVEGAYIAGQGEKSVWTSGLKVIGFRGDEMVDETEWFQELALEPKWMAMNLEQVDRIEFVARPVLLGGGWYAMDDLTYAPAEEETQVTKVVDFDDLFFSTNLTGSGYEGLIWETGEGDFDLDESVPSPKRPKDVPRHEPTLESRTTAASGRAGTEPTLVDSFQGVIRGDAGSFSYPPDTIGAVGPNHFVETVNRNFAIYDKETGAEVTNILLGAFLPNSNGDPRVVYDQYSQRWIVIVTDFSATARIYLAVSMTDDPTGDWFKTDFVTAQGVDAGKWPDYPTLGVDADGIYTAAYMVGGISGMTIFAIDKAPLIQPNPELGTITAWRELLWEGAIQPAHTYGTSAGEYLVSIASSTGIRVRRIDGPLTAPTLVEAGIVSVPGFSDPPNAPALGSTVPLNTVDDRLMMAVYRDGSIWTSHTIDVNGRAACRWYEINSASISLNQWGNVADDTLYYFFPAIMVNQFGDAVMGFTGSHAGIYAGCFYTGRLATDPAGEMAMPVMYKEGTGQQNNIDGYGRNRWGDYSYTVIDPVDETTFFTIQEYGHDTDIWGTYVAKLTMDEPPLRLVLQDEVPDYLYPGLASSFQIEIIDGSETYVPGTGKVLYRYDGGTFIEEELTALGGGLFEANLPNTEPGDAPEFYFSAEGDGGTTIFLPKDAPANLYSFGVYFVVQVVQDEFEVESGWEVQNTDVQTGAWERADPESTDAQPGDDHTPDGTHCYVTGRLGGSSGNDDLDGGPTRLISPTIDLSATTDAEARFFLWFYHSDYGTQQPLEIHVSNNDGSSWKKVTDVLHSASWTERSFKVADHVAPSAHVKVRFSATDNPNDDVVEALLDDFSVVWFNNDPSLWADDYTISIDTGAVIGFTLDAGTENANRQYLLLASASGTSPGYVLPGGTILPLNWDPITDLVLLNLGTPIFQDFLGILDGSGRGQATLLAVGPFDPGLAGLTLNFAYLLGPPPGWNFASNAIGVTLEL